MIIYRAWLHRGVRAKTEIGLYTSEEVAAHICSTYKISGDQTTSYEPVEVSDAGNVDQYLAEERIANIRKLLTPEDLALIEKRGAKL